MAGLDTSIYQPGFTGGGNQFMSGVAEGQKVNQTMINAPTETAQLKANLQTTLSDNERQRLANEQAQRDADFQLWQAHPDNAPKFDEQGNVDTTDYLRRVTDAGHGQYAQKWIASQLDNNLKNVNNRETVVNQIKNAAIQMANANYNTDDKLKPELQQKSDDYLKKQYGVSASEILGPNWMKTAGMATSSPIQQDTNRRQNIEYGNTEEGRNPSSEINKNYRELVRYMAPSYYRDDLTIAQAMQVPGLQETIKSYQIQQPERAAAYGNKVSAEAYQTGIDNVLDRIDNSPLKSVKGLENIKTWINTKMNNEQQVAANALLSDLEKYGIKIDANTSLIGAKDQLMKLRAENAIKLEAANKTLNAKSYSTETPPPAKPGDQPAGGNQPAAPKVRPGYTADGRKMYISPDGKIFAFTAKWLANPANQQRIMADKLKPYSQKGGNQ